MKGRFVSAINLKWSSGVNYDIALEEHSLQQCFKYKYEHVENSVTATLLGPKTVRYLNLGFGVFKVFYKGLFSIKIS